MTVTYSLDVAKATFGGFTRLLLRWRGSIYKILWREFLLFCAGYAALSLLYRHALDQQQRDIFERVVVYVDTFTDLIPLSFVLGFYVSMVTSRWVSQYSSLPWSDRATFMIASYVHGSDGRSRMIRRTLGRYLILLQVLTFQTVSTSVKRRFPTTHHLVEAGLMTREEQSVYEKVSFPYGKWWLPCHWFSALAIRARREGRIQDSLLLNALLQEVMKFRDNCAIMIGFDWISVPLVYTQVVTIATYLYSIALMVGKQYIDPSKGYRDHPVDLYVPVFTLLQFFFYVGWLKVAEQILNPYGEDDDDYELNWLLDRTVNKVYLTVDALHMKHPKVKEDAFWDQTLINLPHTKHSARYLKNPDLGSAHGLDVDEAEYVPVDEWCEQDSEEHQYTGESVRKRKKEAGRQHSSLIRRVFGSKKKQQPGGRSLSHRQGLANPAFSPDEGDRGSPGRHSSLRNLVRKASPSTRAEDVARTASAPGAVTLDMESIEEKNAGDDFEEQTLEAPMPSIPEEGSRANSLASGRLTDRVQVGGVSEELAPDEYESCCSREESSEELDLREAGKSHHEGPIGERDLTESAQIPPSDVDKETK